MSVVPYWIIEFWWMCMSLCEISLSFWIIFFKEELQPILRASLFSHTCCISCQQKTGEFMSYKTQIYDIIPCKIRYFIKVIFLVVLLFLDKEKKSILLVKYFSDMDLLGLRTNSSSWVCKSYSGAFRNKRVLLDVGVY